MSASASIPREDRLVLAIDLGTGGPKVGLVSLTGEVVLAEHHTVETRFLPGGGAVQDAEEWWKVVTDVTRSALSTRGVARKQVVAVSCTGQWASTVPVDDTGRPVGECILWMDGRGGRYSRATFGGPVQGYAPLALLRWIRLTGGAPSTSGSDPIGHMLFLERADPETARAASWYLEPVDYLSMRFTGVAAASHASMTAAWLTDNRHPERLEYDASLTRAAQVPREKLPPLRRTGAVVGVVSRGVASELGLAEDVKVVTGTPDLHTAMIGSGGVDDYKAHMTISTTSWISCPVPFKKTDPFRQVASIPGVFENQYVVVNNHETAGLCLQWLRDNVISPDDSLTGDAAPSFDALTALASRSPAGSGGVLFTPWLAGERSPVEDRSARAGFHNLSLGTYRTDLVRAVLEGVAYNSRWLNDAVERFVGRRLDPIRLLGGGAQSDLWCQIHADVMGRTVERVSDPLHTHLRGAALLAGLAMGDVRKEEIPSLTEVDRVFVPDAASRAVYDRLYDEFPKLYRSQKSMFARLNRGHGAN